MDRNGKKPKATHDDPPHPERSDTKAHMRDEAESTDAEARAAAEKAEVDERVCAHEPGAEGAAAPLAGLRR
jgi:hypothetical protein